MFGQGRPQLPAIVPVQPETLANAEVLIPLTELTDFPACKYFLLSGLEITLDDESTVVDETVFVDDVEDLLVDVDQARCD